MSTSFNTDRLSLYHIESRSWSNFQARKKRPKAEIIAIMVDVINAH